MYISRLSIKNFRNFGDPAFVIGLRPFTLLLGENNIGKSNLLCAVSLLFGQQLSAAQRRMLDTDDFNYDTVSVFKRQVADESVPAEEIMFPQIVIDAILDDISDEQHPVIGDWYSNTGLTQAQVTYCFAVRHNFNATKWIGEQREAIGTQKRIHEERRSQLSDPNGVEQPTTDYSLLVDFPIDEYRHVLYGGGRSGNECEAYLLRMLRSELLDALRDAERELVDGGEQRLLYRVLRQNGDSRYTDVKRSLSELKQAIDADPSLTEIKTDVETFLKLVSLQTPGESHAIGLQFVAPQAAELLKKIGMTYGANPMTVTRNGLGRNNLLYIALLLSQLSKATDPSVGDDSFVCFRFVGIEEPESHLHPHLQDHLARNVEEIREKHSSQLQLLLTSHSTHIAAKLNLDNTAVLFRREPDGRLGVHYVLSGLDPVKDKAAIRFLSLYLDATKSQMLFARRLILVEGIAEQTVIPVLFEDQVGVSLESLGCTVVNVNGVAFKHFLTVVKNGYFKKCVVLTDSDTGTKTENRAESLRTAFKDAAHIKIETSSASTFEKDLIESNGSGAVRELLFSALTMTKPSNGPKFKKETGQADIDVSAFFKEIANYKAEFAFSLASVLRDEADNAINEKRAAIRLIVPAYIKSAFDFVKG
ncbi:MAG: ATP-dependent nuclease [Pirellulaceae bacterium]